MRFLKLLLNIGVILTRTVFCIDNNLEIINRLPNNTIPIHYNINLTLYLEEGNFIFHGESNINIEIRYKSSKISLHSRDLEINETATTLINDKDTVYKPMKHIHNNVTNILTLNFNNVLLPGLYILNMKFSGNLLPVSRQGGFIKFPYIDKGNDTKWLAATYFEPDGARRTFPCWDEPALKATFNISVKHHQKYGVLSNMPIREQFLEQDGMMQTHFDITPIMSTYIVAIVMSDFVRVSNANETINIWCKSSLTSKVKFVHSIAEKVVEFLIQYTNSSQKIPKMDHVLISNFTVGGMENWGLIIYHESKIIYDDSSDPIYRKTEIAITVAHELTHQWFGNLVTPSWWSYLWLNEGFASFFETYIINKIFQDWRLMNFLLIRTLQQCFLKDIGSMNSVTLKLGNTFEKKSLFSDEVYKKAPVLLRMLHNTITDEVFRKGLITYLTTHQFSSASPDDLWSAMQSALDESNVPHKDYRIKEVMDTWMNQERYPFVDVVRNYETGEVTISQTCVRQYSETSQTTKWWIPITFATQSNPDFSNTIPRYWLRPDQHNISFIISPDDWIIVNLQQTGYYRVTYDIKNYQKLAHYLNSKEYKNIHVVNRAQIIIDLLAMVFADRINGYLFIHLISYFFQEREYAAWQPLFQMIESIPTILLLPEFYHIKIRLTQLLEILLDYVGYIDNPNDDDITKLTRLDALKWACTLGHEKCKKMTALKLSEHLMHPKTHKIPYEEEFMYCTGMMAANKTTWDKMLELYLKDEKVEKQILESLSCAEDPDIIINYLNIISLNTSLFHDDEHSFVFKNVLEKYACNDKIRDYVLKNMEIIKPSWWKENIIAYLKNQFCIHIFLKQLSMFSLHQLIYLIILFIKGFDMGFLKLLLNIGLILAIRTIPCIGQNREIIKRLPNNTIPVHYNISLIPYLKEDNFTFYGKSNVNIEIRYASSKISLHSRELKINETATTLINDNNTVYKPLKHIYNVTTNILTLNFNDILSPGLYILNMKFAGNLSKSSQKQGFMKFSYTTYKGNTKWLAVTHFEPNGAKRMFPCWDEPALKATFNISILHHQTHSVLSNMPIRKQFLEQKDMIHTHFETTPVMSTYIVAIVMIDFIKVPNANNTINMWCKSLTSKVTLAHNIAEKVVKFLIQYTNSSLKVPKMDYVLIPKFVVGSMENWGLITYDESKIVYDDNKDPTYQKTKVALTVTHKLAHQWFGNLVTPSWWSYLWLSKGLASFFQTYIINKIFENYRRTTELLTIQKIQQCHHQDTSSLNFVTMKLGSTFEDNSLNSFVYKKGYYRVSYDTKNWQKIAHYLNSNNYTKIHVFNRAQIIIDWFISMLDDRMNSYSFFQFIRYLSKDRDYVAWQPLFEIIEHMPTLLLPELIHIKKIIKNDDITKLTRINALKCACILGNKKCKEVTALKLSKYLADPKTYKIPQKEKFMYCAGMMAANRTTWDKMFKLYLKKEKKWERTKLLKSWSCAEDLDIIINYLNILALNTSLFHNNTHSFIFKCILEKHARNDLILDHILNNFTIIILILAIRMIPCIGIKNLEIMTQLPRNTIPIQYNIHLTTYLKQGNYTFYGESNVNIKIRYASSIISLHSRELKIIETATTLINDNGTIYKPMKHTHNNITDILTLNFNKILSPGLYILNMKFVGYFSEPSENLGFMKFSHIASEKQKLEFAITHFLPNGARRMFPCWDEPALKATFNISVMHHTQYRILSNMPVKEIYDEQDNMRTTYFETTPIMPTYTVTIVMLQFISFSSLVHETIHTFWCHRSTLVPTYLGFAHNVSEKITEILTEYTNCSLKISKIDHVVIPEFTINGTGNWGLITYDYSNLIYDKEKDPTYEKVLITMFITHKLAFQWFGNLVTPSWWPYLWLSEGIASFIQKLVVEKSIFFLQIFKLPVMYLLDIENIQQCLLQDIGSLNSVTLKSSFDDILDKLPHYFTEIFNKFLLRMLCNTITAEIFRKGLITYLVKHQFSTATPNDLWSAMQSALDESDIPHENYTIKEVMDTWLNQERYPVVRVERNYETGEVTISQTCIQQHGYYRVNYDIRNWEKISHYLNTNEYANIHVLNRAQIIADLHAMVIDDRIGGYLFLQLINYLKRDTNGVAWQPLLDIIYIMPKPLLLPEMKHVKERYKQLLHKFLQHIKYKRNRNDDDVTKLTRINALKCACNLGIKKCKEVTALKLNRHLMNPETYKIPRREKFMYCTGMMAANKTTWNKMFDIYIRGKLNEDPKRLLMGLSCAENPNIIINYLNILAFNTSFFDNDDHAHVFKYILKRHSHNDKILKYILNNFEAIKPK
ncbi:AMPN Aminopeptidase, partial [Pseudoatta argentina]